MNLFIFILITVLVSFTCSLLEAFILSVRPSYLKVKVKEGLKSAILLHKLKKDPGRPLAAILTINTFANMVGATGVGSEVQNMYGNTYVTLASIVLAFVVLIVSEIFPKTLGAKKWKTLTPFAGYIIQVMIYLTWPFVVLSQKINKNTVFFGKEGPNLLREEVAETAAMGASEGSLKEKESLVIKNLLLLDTISISEIMTPRSVMYAFEENTRVENLLKQQDTIRFSRIPVYKENLDNIIGIVHRYRILEASSQDYHTLKLKDMVKPVHNVPESLSVSAVLDQFLKKKEHLFCVEDSHGVLSGIVTLEDAIETLLGVEIIDEFDSVVDMRAHALEKWSQLKKKKNL